MVLEDYLMSRNDPRLIGKEFDFVYNPYFGFLYERGLVQWTSGQEGSSLTPEERRELLEKAYEMAGEKELYDEMIKRQAGRL